MRDMKAQAPEQYANVSQMDTAADTGPMIGGWTVFGGVMLLLAGAFGAINGIIALLNSDVYVAGENNVVLFDFTQWGWIHLIGGGIVALVGLIVIGSGALWARILGVIVAIAHAIAQVSFIEAYPFWTTVTIALDILVIYALLVSPTPKRTMA